MSIKKALVLLVILIGGCFLYSCNVSENKGNLEDDKKESINVKDSTTSIDMVQENRLNIDSINDEDDFFKLTSIFELPKSFNLNGSDIMLSDFSNGKHNEKMVFPYTKNHVREINSIAFKRYINDAIKKYYSDNVDLHKFLSDKNPRKLYGLGSIILKKDFLTSMLIYMEVLDGKDINKFIVMVNYDTNAEVYLHSALLAAEIKSASDTISLGSVLSDGPESTVLIKQKYAVNGKEKEIIIEINKGFYYQPPSEGGPDPKDYIKYL